MWFVLLDASDAGLAHDLGVNYAPKLINIGIGCPACVQTVTIDDPTPAENPFGSSNHREVSDLTGLGVLLLLALSKVTLVLRQFRMVLGRLLAFGKAALVGGPAVLLTRSEISFFFLSFRVVLGRLLAFGKGALVPVLVVIRFGDAIKFLILASHVDLLLSLASPVRSRAAHWTLGRRR